MGRLFKINNSLCIDKTLHHVPSDHVFYHSLSKDLNPELGSDPTITGIIEAPHNVDGISCITFTPGNYMIFSNCCPQPWRGTWATTISCWVKFDVLGTSGTVGKREQIVSLFGNDRAITNYPYSYGLLNRHCIFCDQSYGQTTYFTFSADKWHHVIFETTASSSGESAMPESRCFVDCVQKGENAINSALWYNSVNYKNLFIGSRKTCTVNIASVRIYDRTLTYNEIVALHREHLPSLNE